MQKQNGFPTSYAYLCGYGARVKLDDDNRIQMFEDDSHNGIDIKGFCRGQHFWDRFSYEDYPNRHSCQKAAEAWYRDKVNMMNVEA